MQYCLSNTDCEGAAEVTHPERSGYRLSKVHAQRVDHNLNMLIDGVRPCGRAQHRIDLHQHCAGLMWPLWLHDLTLGPYVTFGQGATL
jgi:hypothetical protein